MEAGLGAIKSTASAAWSACFLLLSVLSVNALAWHIWALDRFGPESEKARVLRIDMDNSYSEMFEYAMLLAAAVTMIFIALRRRTAVILLPAILCGYLVFDNAFQLHESAGRMLYPEHARAGEIIFAALMIVTAIGIGWRVLRNADIFDRQALFGIALVMLAFSFFAVGVDAIHSIVAAYWPRYALFVGGIEDFGEMLAIALLVAVAVQLLQLATSKTNARI